MDDTNSESSTPTSPPTVASILGVKGALRFRRHGASQKAHVVLRRVDVSDDSNIADGKPSVAYFSLFAQKRIEVKPGKEILLAVASEDGSFTDQAVIFEGDLSSASDSNTEEEEEVEKQIVQDEALLDSPSAYHVPPKMRRTWTKQLQQVSSPVIDTVVHPPPTYVSVSVQAEPTWSVSSVQTVSTASSVQEQTAPLTSESTIEVPAEAQEPSVEVEAPALEPDLPPPTEAVPIPDAERSRSLSPMSIGSPPSTPPQSPLIGRATNLIQIPSPPTTEPPVSLVGDHLPISQQAQEEKEKEYIAVTAVAPPIDVASRTSQVSPVSSETVDMDLQSSPSSSEVDEDEIPGFITGPLSRRPGPPPRQPSPLVLSPPQARPQPMASVLPALAIPSKCTILVPNEPKESEPPEPTALVAAPPLRRPPPPIKNPFVSGGFMTEFVGESLTTRITPSPKESMVSEKYNATTTAVFSNESPATKYEPSTVYQPVPRSSPSYISQQIPGGTVSEARAPLITRQSPPLVQPQPQARQLQNLPRPPPRPSEITYTYSQKSPAWSNYPPPPPAAVNDEYNPIESLSNALNVQPSSRFAPPPPYQNHSIRPPSPYQYAAAAQPVSENGWPSFHSNGRAPMPTTLSLPRNKVPLPPPPRPHSTRSSTTPPGLSSAPYSSPSPPGFLHSASSHKPSPVREPISYGQNKQTTTLTSPQHWYSPPIPQVKHESLDWTASSVSSTSTSINSISSSQHIRIQAPRPLIPLSAASAVLHYRQTTTSKSPTPSEDSKGKKRALDSDAQLESSRPRKRSYPWPVQESFYSARIKSEEVAGVQQIAFSSDGERFAIICGDRTIRIWNTQHKVETARLAQNAPVQAIAWMTDDAGVVTLGQDGVISKWTRNNQSHWQWAKLLDAGKEDSVCFAYQRDRIAVAFPRVGVKVWIWIKGTWQPQRSILRQNVTSIRFVEDGEALIGGTSDGVLWYCQVPNGTLRAYAFLKSKVLHLDVNLSGTHALVSQSGGRAHLVGIQRMDHKGKIEQVYATNGDSGGENKQGGGAVFANGCRLVLFGTTDSNMLVWDKAKGEIVCGYDHDGEQVQAVASFDKGSNVHIITGTKNGLLSWWRPFPTD